MVHYKPVVKGYMDVNDRENEPWEREYRKDTYWMLGFYLNKTVSELEEYLDAHGYHYPKNATKAVLMGAVGRLQRGLLSYESYSTDELRAFCQARNISARSRAETSRLARSLRQADDNATFPRFLDLSAELRIKIYELHFSDYDEITTRHRQPPLTLVPCIRAEALPYFYGSVTFSWDLVLKTSWSNFGHHFEGDSLRLLGMPAANLAQVKNFKLNWVHQCRRRDWSTVSFSAHVSQRNNVTKTFAVEMEREEDDPLPALEEDTVRTWLDKMGYWDVAWNLQQRDLRAIEKAMIKVVRRMLDVE